MGNFNPLSSKLMNHPLCQLKKLRLGIVAPRDTRLVRDHEQDVAEVLRRSAKLEDSFPKVELLTRMYIALFNINDTIPV